MAFSNLFGSGPRDGMPKHMSRLKDLIATRLNLSIRRNLPMLRQIEAAECGLACMAMVASYHGCITDVASMRKRFPISVKGATLLQLVRIASAMNLTARPVRLELDELRQLTKPCILHWNMDHCVVLKKVSGGHVVIHDPARGVRRCSLSETSKRFTVIYRSRD